MTFAQFLQGVESEALKPLFETCFRQLKIQGNGIRTKEKRQQLLLERFEAG
jgi:hypothetical protein